MSYPETPGSVPGSETSVAAAIQVGEIAEQQRNDIRNVMLRMGNATCDEIEIALDNKKSQTVAARIRELVMLGRARILEERRLNRRGISVRVYEAADLLPDYTLVNQPNRYVGHSTEATRKRIRDAIQALGDATFAEIADETGLLPQTTTPAIADMLLLGEVVDSGRKRKTRYGGNARVLTLTLKVDLPEDVP